MKPQFQSHERTVKKKIHALSLTLLLKTYVKVEV